VGLIPDLATLRDRAKAKLLKIMIEFYDLVNPLIRKGIPIEKVRDLGIVKTLMRLKEERGVEPISRPASR
jgi:hypothetical protein